MKKIDYGKLFNMFIDPNGEERGLNHPFIQDEKYIASDGVSLIYLPVGKATLNFPKQDKPNISSTISAENNCSILLNVKKLEEQLVPEMIDEEKILYEDCSECKGDGYVKYTYSGEKDYEAELECPKCDGKCEKKIVEKTGKQIPNDWKLFQLIDAYFAYKQLRRLIDAVNLIGVDEITLEVREEKKANRFSVGDFKIIIMSSYSEGYKTQNLVYELKY